MRHRSNATVAHARAETRDAKVTGAEFRYYPVTPNGPASAHAPTRTNLAAESVGVGHLDCSCESIRLIDMSQRLQVLLDEEEFAEIRRTARRHRMTVAEWVRQALREARREEPAGDPRRKLTAVRDAARHSYPTADIAQMLGEIERGYLGGDDA